MVKHFLGVGTVMIGTVFYRAGSHLKKFTAEIPDEKKEEKRREELLKVMRVKLPDVRKVEKFEWRK